MSTASPFFDNNEDKLKQEEARTDTTSTVPTLYLDSGATTVRVLPTWKGGWSILQGVPGATSSV